MSSEIPSQTELLNAIDTITQTIQDEENTGNIFQNSNISEHVEPIDMFNVIETLNNVSAENDHQEICTICQDILDNGEQIHFLPECNHGYHTNCILTWFRTGNNNCPCCGNRGVNFKEPIKQQASRGYRWNRWGFASRRRLNPNYIRLRAFSFRKDAPKQLKEIVDKLKGYESELIEMVREFKEGAKERDVMKFKEVQTVVKNFHNRRHRLQNKINEYVIKIGDYPIVPLIIPVKKTV